MTFHDLRKIMEHSNKCSRSKWNSNTHSICTGTFFSKDWRNTELNGNWKENPVHDPIDTVTQNCSAFSRMTGCSPIFTRSNIFFSSVWCSTLHHFGSLYTSLHHCIGFFVGKSAGKSNVSEGKNLGVATFFLKSFSWDCPEMNSTLKICEFHTKNEQKNHRTLPGVAKSPVLVDKPTEKIPKIRIILPQEYRLLVLKSRFLLDTSSINPQIPKMLIILQHPASSSSSSAEFNSPRG